MACAFRIWGLLEAIVRGDTKYYHGICTPRYKITTLEYATGNGSLFSSFCKLEGSFAIITTVILMGWCDTRAAEVSATGRRQTLQDGEAVARVSEFQRRIEIRDRDDASENIDPVFSQHPSATPSTGPRSTVRRILPAQRAPSTGRWSFPTSWPPAASTWCSAIRRGSASRSRSKNFSQHASRRSLRRRTQRTQAADRVAQGGAPGTRERALYQEFERPSARPRRLRCSPARMGGSS
jgi:hypothetical protein